MSKQTEAVSCHDDWIYYGNILEEFDKYDRSKSSSLASKRGSLLHNQKARLISPDSVESKALSPRTTKQKIMRSKSTKHDIMKAPIVLPVSVKSEELSPRNSKLKTIPNQSTNYGSSRSTRQSKSTAVTSSLSDESPGAKSAGAINEALAAENRRLKKVLKEMEKQIGKDGGKDAKKSSDEVGTDVMKFNRKIKKLETKCKDERMKTMQMSKHVEAHHAEIVGLRRELAKALNQVEALERDRESDMHRVLNLTDELEEWRQGDGSPSLKELKSELRQRNNELEATLELLESKVHKIVELEIQLRETNDKLRMPQHANAGRIGNEDPQSISSMSAELRESKAECKKLKRQNMMLRLLFQEQEDNRKGHGGDLDSVSQKVASNFGFASNLGFVLKGRREAGLDLSARTDACRVPSVEKNSPVSVIPSLDNFLSIHSSSSLVADDLFLEGN